MSRGLGDVYKRQVICTLPTFLCTWVVYQLAYVLKKISQQVIKVITNLRMSEKFAKQRKLISKKWKMGSEWNRTLKTFFILTYFNKIPLLCNSFIEWLVIASHWLSAPIYSATVNNSHQQSF